MSTDFDPSQFDLVITQTFDAHLEQVGRHGPRPDDKIEKYREMAAEAGKSWIKHGALHYFERIGDDLEPVTGDAELATFPHWWTPDLTIIPLT